MRNIKMRSIIMVLTFILVLAISSVGMAETAVANTNVIVHAGPSMDTAAVGDLFAGTYVTVNFAQGAWCDITFGNTNGYVPSSCLSEGTEKVVPVISQPTAIPSITGPVPEIQQPVPVIQQPVPVVQQQPVPVIQSGSTNMYTTSKLNVRSGPSTKYSKIGVLSPGTPVCVLGSVGNWYSINFNGVVGYISSKYVAAGSQVVSGFVTPMDEYMMTNSSTTVYKGTGRQYGEVGAFPAGYTAHVVGCLGNWYKVVFGNGYGYVPRAYLSRAYQDELTFIIGY